MSNYLVPISPTAIICSLKIVVSIRSIRLVYAPVLIGFAGTCVIINLRHYLCDGPVRLHKIIILIMITSYTAANLRRDVLEPCPRVRSKIFCFYTITVLFNVKRARKVQQTDTLTNEIFGGFNANA